MRQNPGKSSALGSGHTLQPPNCLQGIHDAPPLCYRARRSSIIAGNHMGNFQTHQGLAMFHRLLGSTCTQNPRTKHLSSERKYQDIPIA